jgi:hypothetical protein
VISPHANVCCAECHIGRAFVGEQFARKAEDLREVFAMVFHTYEFPIRAMRSRPARETCEKCHAPQTASTLSLWRKSNSLSKEKIKQELQSQFLFLI